jgi:dTDP-L-rhamnose 4-epimerase
MKVLVTGGAGFIGSHVVDALCEDGATVICLDSLDPGVHHGPPSYLRSDVDYCFADLRHWVPDDRFEDVDAIVHLAALGGVGRAAREPANIVDANCRGTARLAEFARGLGRLQVVVLGSSFSVYGAGYRYRCPHCYHEFFGHRRPADLDSGRFEVLCPQCGTEGVIQPITEGSCPDPLETYGASKYMQELCFRSFARCPVRVLRFSSVYGSRLRLDDGEAAIIARIAGWVRSGQSPKLHEDGRQIRDWVYVRDVVAAVRALVGGASAPSVMNVCSGSPTRLVEACAGIADTLGVACRPHIVGGYRPGDMRHCLGDPSNLRILLGRDPVVFSEGVRRAFAGERPGGSVLRRQPRMLATAG